MNMVFAMALQRLGPEAVKYDLGPVKMWRDDLVRIVKFILDCSQQVELTTEEYKLNDVEDLAELAAKRIFTIKQFVAVSDGGRIHLRLDESVAELTLLDPDYNLRGMASEVLRVAKECRRPLFTFLPYASGLSLTALASALTSVLVPMVGRIGLPEFARRPSVAILHTRSRAEAPSFWSRKRDDLTITIVSNLFSLFLGGVIGYFVNKLSSK